MIGAVVEREKLVLAIELAIALGVTRVTAEVRDTSGVGTDYTLSLKGNTSEVTNAFSVDLVCAVGAGTDNVPGSAVTDLDALTKLLAAVPVAETYVLLAFGVDMVGPGYSTIGVIYPLTSSNFLFVSYTTSSGKIIVQ